MRYLSRLAFASLFVMQICSWEFAVAQEAVGGATPAPIVTAGAALKDPSSYALGFDIGMNLARSKMSDKELVSQDFLAGVLDALSKRDPKLNPQQMEVAFQSLQQRMQKKMLAIAKENLEKSNAYLEANKKKDGVQVLKSGLQYVVLKSGPATGKMPTIQDTVLAHYEGKLIDGTVFDSSIKSNQPAKFQLTKVVPGWTEVLQRMRVGDKWLVTLPPALGYGENGLPPADIGPNEALIFELELLDVVK